MHVDQADTQGNTNIGLYAYCNDAFCILGPEAQNLKERLEELLDVPVITTTIAGTSLAGVFLAGNKNALLVPEITYEHEIEALEETGVPVHVLHSKHTALGNNILANDHGALVGPMFTAEECEQIRELLDVPIQQGTIADVEVVGASLAVNTMGGLIHRDASTLEKDLAQNTLDLPRLLAGTVNFGVPYVRSGLIANTNGFLIGKGSGGPEITNADEALGFTEG